MLAFAPTVVGERREPGLRDHVVRLVELRAGDAPSAERVVDVIAVAVDELCRRFAALVGDSGIAAILDRSGKERAVDLGAVRRWPEQIAQLRDRLHALEAPLAREAGISLVTTFLGMVCTFIGEPLTLRLVHDVWPETFVGPKEPT